MSVNKLLDVEQHVWSPMYGLKGNIDATVQVTMQDDLGKRTLTVPLEVKTGKTSANFAHIAQTALYNLLLSNRYGECLTICIVSLFAYIVLRYQCCLWHPVLSRIIRYK